MRHRTQLVDPRPEPGPEYDRPSKSQMKRDMTALQDLGRELAALSPERLAQLALPDRLRDAIADFRRITAHEGARRQMQFIGRLMRDVDPAPLRDALERFHGTSRAEVAEMHAAERWRERLLADPQVLAEFAAAHPAADQVRLRALVRGAAAEKTLGKPPRQYRELYRALREAMAARTDSTDAKETS
ncbi:MAG: DUF615 domain-containing protein [Burkholderiales bacterium]|nr:DUF615 domain-containing protein [Burkholderiales bacterium]